MRSISAALQAEFDKAITSVGYFVQWNMTPLMRWSNIGDITWNGMIFVDFDFSIEGLDFQHDRELRATITCQNLDSTIAAQFLNAPMADVTVDIWQFERDALAAGDVPKLVQLACDGVEIGLKEEARIQLLEQGSISSFAPRRRVDPSGGFSYAIAPGTKIAWGAEIFELEEARG